MHVEFVIIEVEDQFLKTGLKIRAKFDHDFQTELVNFS